MARDLRCPSCGAAIPWTRARDLQPFACPSCAHGLKVRASYVLPLYYIGFALSAIAAYAAGLRGLTLLFAATVGNIVIVAALVRALAVVLIRPALEETGDYKAVLFGVPPAPPDDDGGSVEGGVPGVEGRHGPRAGEPEATPALFQAPPERRTLEGTAIALGFAALLVCYAWLSFQGAADALFRETTLWGPPAFRAQARVGARSITFVSPSRELMSCSARLGNDDALVVGFALRPLGTETVPYSRIRGVDTDGEVDAARTAARWRIALRCSDSTLHSVMLAP